MHQSLVLAMDVLDQLLQVLIDNRLYLEQAEINPHFMLFLQGYFTTAIGKEIKTPCKHKSLTLLPRNNV